MRNSSQLPTALQERYYQAQIDENQRSRNGISDAPLNQGNEKETPEALTGTIASCLLSGLDEPVPAITGQNICYYCPPITK
jgi:hypothetical protein